MDSATFSVTFWVNSALVPTSDTMLLSLEVQNANPSQGLSSDTETVTVNLAAEATIDSYYLRVKPYIGGTIENLTNMNMAYLDSFDFEVDTTSSLTLYLVIIAADNASLTFSTMTSGLAFTESPSGSGHYHINLTIGDIMA